MEQRVRRVRITTRYYRLGWLTVLALAIFLAWELFTYPLTGSGFHR
ncbi:hypothetical protein [Hymenobacter seoulensis]